MTAAVSICGVQKHFGALHALNDVSLEVPQGSFFGLLGPNGAGKSTTMQMLTGNLAPTAGAVTINGVDMLENPKEAKLALGYLPEQPPLYRELTVDEYLTYCARLNRIEKGKIAAAVDNAKLRCGLTEVNQRLINNLSKGYQQRVGIAQAIIHSPDVVILDEASQSDVLGLTAFALAKEVVVVGDHEQVSPYAVGQKGDRVQALIDELLVDIPNKQPYDGKTSVYDLARQSFGGTIRLLPREPRGTEAVVTLR